MRRYRILAAALIGMTVVSSGCAKTEGQAEGQGGYPAAKVTFLCPSEAGGAMDTNTRFIAPYLEKYLGAKVDVMNMGGSAGWVGWNYLSENEADGSMIAYANFPNMITGYLDPAASIGLDRSNFEYLALYTSDDNVIMAKKDEERFKDAESFFDYASEHVVTIGTAGPRTDDAVAVALLEKDTGISFQHVHYQNSAEAFAAVMGGHVDVMMGNVSEAVQKGDEILPVAVLKEERSSYLPEVQTTYEAGVEVAAASSRGIIAKKGLDENAKGQLLEALQKAMEDSEQMEEAGKQGIAVTPIYGEEFEEWMAGQEEQVKGIMDMLDN